MPTPTLPIALPVPPEHREFARAMLMDDLRASRELLASDLEPDDARSLTAEIADDEQRLQHLLTDGVLTGPAEWLLEILTSEVRERWEPDRGWRDPATVAWLGCCCGLVCDLLDP